MKNSVFCLMGPTASGKTAFACELVQQFPFEIISVDSAMIYRDMNIGTAKPSPEELRLAPHHLIDIINPDESYSVGQFCSDATRLCHSITNKGKIPLLVGGTMMYFNALQKGLSALPEADEDIRKEIESEAAVLGWSTLYEQLAKVDAITAARIHAHDTQRIQRALEVYRVSGIALSTLLAQQKLSPVFRFTNFSLFPNDRTWLHERIALRFDNMLSQGLVEETRVLMEKWPLNKDLPSMRCVGYRQVLEFLKADCDYQTMQDKGVAATRQLAKRQLTWLRHWGDSFITDSQNPTFKQEIIAKTKEILDNESS